MIAIIDYGVGNLGSIRNMLTRIGTTSRITGDAAAIEAAEKIILPGVGAFGRAMDRLRDRELIPVLNACVDRGTPTLGICLGMQLLTNGSEEGDAVGLGWIDAETVAFRFPDEERLTLPSMGWNTVRACRDSELFTKLDRGARFYFAHSYHVHCRRREDVLGVSTYGIEFDSVVRRDNVFGTQFHPEKSHKFGMQLLQNFAAMSI